MVNVFIFIVIKTYPSLKVSALESWGTYWLYASISVLGAVFGATLLPETKGKALAEISDHFYVCCTLDKRKKKEDVERRFKRRSMEFGDKEGSLKRRTQELSMLDEEIQQKAEALREQEIKLKLKSAPIVQLSE